MKDPWPYRCPRCGSLSKTPGLCTMHKPAVLRKPQRDSQRRAFREGHGS